MAPAPGGAGAWDMPSLARAAGRGKPSGEPPSARAVNASARAANALGPRQPATWRLRAARGHLSSRSHRHPGKLAGAPARLRARRRPCARGRRVPPAHYLVLQLPDLAVPEHPRTVVVHDRELNRGHQSHAAGPSRQARATVPVGRARLAGHARPMRPGYDRRLDRLTSSGGAPHTTTRNAHSSVWNGVPASRVGHASARPQITPFWRPIGGYGGERIAAPNGGYLHTEHGPELITLSLSVTHSRAAPWPGRRQKDQGMILRAPEVQHHTLGLSTARIVELGNPLDQLVASQLGLPAPEVAARDD